MTKLLSAIIFILFLDFALVVSSSALAEIGGDGLGINCANSTLNKVGGCNGDINQEPKNSVLGGGTVVEESSGNVVIDVFLSVRNWIINDTPAGYIWGILTAPGQLLALLNLPTVFQYGLNAIWWGIHFLLIIYFIKGGES